MSTTFQNGSENVPNNKIALAVRKGCKSFSKKDPPILNNFSMTIPTGSVYSLLGSSGCGKTTLISCILGLLKLDEGEIFFNDTSEDSQQDDRLDIGYMPQETSLYTHLSIEETLQYFGRLFGVNKNSLRGIIPQLVKVLSLPDKRDLVGELSGGQKKRVSLAVALIHQPKMLILDEPTSGVDPILRVNIWQYLRQLANDNQVTVLLTTHYTEEARSADIVGVMRDGCLVAEESPDKLMQNLSVTSLEKAVSCLWKRNGAANEITSTNAICRATQSVNVSNLKKVQMSIKRIQALVWKNRVTMWRSIVLLCFVTLTPAVNILTTYIAVQYDPFQNLPLAVVNNEADCFNKNSILNRDELCALNELSCKFIKQLNSSGSVRPSSYSSLELAADAVQNGNVYGTLTFSKNFTNSLIERMLSMEDTDEVTWNESTIHAQLDQSNTVIYASIMSTLYATLEKFMVTMATECGQSSKLGEFSLQYTSAPLVGKENRGVVDYYVPGFSYAFLIYFPMISSSVRIIGEKRLGTMTRILAAGTRGQGTKLWEFLTAYMITETGVAVLQTIILDIIIKGLVFVEANGDYYNITLVFLSFFSLSNALVVAIFILGGFSAVCFGCFLGAVCTQEIQAGLISLAVFLPNVVLSGLAWPVEGMPIWLQYISPCFPFTMPSESLRSLLSRNWEFSHPGVWPGFVAVGLHTLFYFVLLVAFTSSRRFNLQS